MKRAKGFTLLELMIVVVVVAILAAVAIPSYMDHIRRTRRADAKQVMLEAAQWMERNYTTTQTYVTTLPALLQQSPREGPTSYYIIRFGPGSTTNNTSATTFELRAIPQGGQTSDKCGPGLTGVTLVYTNLGVRSLTSGTAAQAQDCWGR